MKIKSIRFKNLRNEAHYEFLVVVNSLLNKFPSVMAFFELCSEQLYRRKRILCCFHN
jgi:hypothetical protein